MQLTPDTTMELTHNHPHQTTKLIGEETSQGHSSQRTLETAGEEFSEQSNDEMLEKPTNSKPTLIPASLWNFICSFLFPLLVQSLFGGFHIVRTILLGYALQYSSQLLSLTENTAIQVLGKSATPPPAFLGLAFLTIAAFVIHPDGFTWIILRKIRNGLIWLIETSSTGWTIVVNEFPVISSVLALVTLFGLAFVVFIMQRTLSSKTPQHRARHPTSDKQQKRKKRKHKTKGRIRNPLPNSRDDEEEPVDDQNLVPTVEQAPNVLPPLVEDKPVLETIQVQSQSSIQDENGWSSCQRRDVFDRDAFDKDSLDSNFEDSSSCETSVSSASAATPNRYPKPSTDQKDYTIVSNSRRRVKEAIHSTSVGGDDEEKVHRFAIDKVLDKQKAPRIIAPSRWDALKPASRTERYVPAQRMRNGRNETRNNRRGRKQNHKSYLPPAASSSLFNSRVAPNKSTCTPVRTRTTETDLVRSAFDSHQKHRIDMELNPESPPWDPSHLTITPVLAPPPGLDHVLSKEIPFGCGSSDGAKSVPRGFNTTIGQEYPGERSLFGTIGPSIPTVDQETDFTSTYNGDGEPFSAAAISIRSSVSNFTENPYEQFGSTDDDKIEAQLQELGGQMVGSLLDF